MIRVLLADDQNLVRQGIRALLSLSTEFEIVGEASDGEEALALIEKTRPEVALIDVRMPRLTGIEVLRSVRQRCPEVGVILLTTFDEDAVVLEAVRLGVQGFLLKDISLGQLEDAVRTVAAGGSLIRPAVTEHVLSGVDRRPTSFESSESPDALTPREREVLRLIAAGYSNREIAEVSGTAEGTVKNQTSSILSKLGVRDRTRAVLKALELGLT
ncbi:MAG: response regulator transcription factor [Acidobacteria bacterium]|nr:response regulator transcription factor [Acidobacteriota bacterium]